MDDERHERHRAQNRQRRDQTRGEPVVFLTLVEHELEGADPDREHADAPVVDAPRRLPDVGRVEDEHPRHDERRDPDRNVDVEDPSPAVVVGQPAAQHRSENRRDDDPEPPEAHRLAAILGREGFEQHRLRQRLHRAAGRALQTAEHDQHRQVRREAAQKRRDGESGDREHDEALAPEPAGEPAGHRQDDRVGDQVRRQRPRRLVDRGRETPGDVRQRHVDHGGVEHLHEGREHHRDGDDPGVDLARRSLIDSLSTTEDTEDVRRIRTLLVTLIPHVSTVSSCGAISYTPSAPPTCPAAGSDPDPGRPRARSSPARAARP